MHHVVYRSGDNHLHELWWIGPGRVNDGDITKAANAVPASGDASCYFDPVRGTNIVCFRGTDGRIRSLYWDGGPVGQDDLSGTARTVAAAGDPTAYFSTVDDTHYVTYVGTNGHVIQLSWPNVAPVSGRDLTAAPVDRERPAPSRPGSTRRRTRITCSIGLATDHYTSCGDGSGRRQSPMKT